MAAFKFNWFAGSDELCFIYLLFSRTRTAQSAGLNVIGSRFCNSCDAGYVLYHTHITCLLPDIHQEVELQVRR